MALTQILHGLNDSNMPAGTHLVDNDGKLVSKKDKKAEDAQPEVTARANISHN